MTEALARRPNSYLHRALMKVRPAPLAAFIKKIANIKRTVITTKHGIYWLDPVSVIGRELMDTGSFEPALTTRLCEMLSHSGVFVDVGANEGYFSVIAARIVGVQGKVLAIEPQDRLAPIIQRNAELNGLANIVLDNRLISDRSGIVKLALAPDINSGSSGVMNAARYPVAWQDAQADTLESIIDSHEIHDIDCMKIDIEGSEYEAVMGSQNLFTSGRVKRVLIEIHTPALNKRNIDASEIIRFLCSSGYREIWSIDRHYYALERNSIGSLP